MTTDIALREVSQKEVSIAQLEESFAIAVRQRELLAGYIKERLHPGKHFYKVAEGQKPSLTKEGAELICLPHAYKPAYEVIGGPQQPLDGDKPYQIMVKCTLRKGERFEGEGVGSASSWITKKDGTRQPRQRDSGLCHNATLKMAQKSAYIAATLNATAASEFFTQDLEDWPDGVDVAKDMPSGPGRSQYFCTEHKTPWFKKGKMHRYAHPIGDTGDWCDMPEASQSAPRRTEDDATAPEPPQGAVGARLMSPLAQVQAQARELWPSDARRGLNDWAREQPELAMWVTANGLALDKMPESALLGLAERLSRMKAGEGEE